MSVKSFYKKIPLIGPFSVFLYKKTIKRWKNHYFFNKKFYNKNIKRNEINSLKSIGVFNIKELDFDSWKFDSGLDHSFRRYYLALYKGKESFIKISNNDLTVLNEIEISSRRPEFEFSPKTYFIDQNFNDGYLIIQEKKHNLKKLYFKDFVHFQFICRQVNKILDELFTIGLVHCDIHRGNLLLDNKTSRVYLLDYGISRFIDVPNKIDYVARPGTYYRVYKKGNKTIRIYDDAYSFVKTTENLSIQKEWENCSDFQEIKKKIDRLFVEIEVEK